MATTTISNLPSPVQQYFNKVLLSPKQPYLIYTLPAIQDMMPQHNGNINRRRRYNTIAPSIVPLGPSGLPGQPVNVPVTDIDATLNFGVLKSSLIDLEAYGICYGDKAQVAFATA